MTNAKERSMTRWWRAHASAVDDPKLQRLPGDLFKAWFNVLCLACTHDGTLPPLPDIAFKLRKSEDATVKILDALQAADLLDVTDDGMTPHNWNKRQYKSDVSTERVKRFRQQHRNGDETFPKRPQRSESDTDTDTETEADTEKKEEKGKSGAVAPLPPLAEAVAAFNQLAEEHDWPKVQVLNILRKRALTTCLKAVGGIDGWQSMLAKAAASDFLTGKVERSEAHSNWRMDFDFLLKPKRYTKLMEGGYDNSDRTSGSKTGLSAVLAALAD